MTTMRRATGPPRSTGSTSRPRRRRSGTRSPAPSGPESYGYGGRAEYDLRPGGAYRGMTERSDAGQSAHPTSAIDGEVIEADPPHRLVQTWRMVMDEAMAAEGFTRLTYEIAEGKGGVTKLTVIHELEGAPQLAGADVGRHGRPRAPAAAGAGS